MADELKILEGIYLFALSNSNWLEALELSTRLNLYRKGERVSTRVTVHFTILSHTSSSLLDVHDYRTLQATLMQYSVMLQMSLALQSSIKEP